MKVESEEQRGVILELIARAHRSPEEVAMVERVRKAIITAEMERPEAPDED